MNRLIPASAFAALLLGLTATRARADISISATNVTIASGQTTGTMDFTISYVDNSMSVNNSDTLSAFGLGLLITPAANQDLGFDSTQFNPWDNVSLSGDYVFAGESFGSDNPPYAFWGDPTPTNYANDTIIAVGDFDDSSSVTIPTSSSGPRTYLASVQFKVINAPTNTETFQVSLVPDSTSFSDANFADLPPPTFMGGSVTLKGVSGASVVPEPTSTITSLTGAAVLTAYGWLRHRRSKRRPD